MSEWKQELDASLRRPDLARLEALRKQARNTVNVLHEQYTDLIQYRRERDYSRIVDSRSRLEISFDTHHRLLNEAQRIGTRNAAAMNRLQEHVDSVVEEWKAGAIRIFIDWFARNQDAISPALTSPNSQELVSLMSASKNLNLDTIGRNSLIQFLLWDGSDFTKHPYARLFLNTPLTTSVPEREHVFALERISPNPFIHSTTIGFSIRTPGPVRLSVVDYRNRDVTVLLDEELPVGKHSAVFSAGNLPSGSYYVKLTTRDILDVLPVMLSR